MTQRWQQYFGRILGEKKYANLQCIKTLRDQFKIDVGYSDHTADNICASSSVFLGASLVEKHITLSKSMEGPDHILSSEPKEMGES